LHFLQYLRQANLLRFVILHASDKTTQSGRGISSGEPATRRKSRLSTILHCAGPAFDSGASDFDTSKRVLARQHREKQDRRAYSVPRSDVLSSLETSFSLFTPSICSITSIAACGTRCCQGSLRSILFRISEPE